MTKTEIKQRKRELINELVKLHYNHNEKLVDKYFFEFWDLKPTLNEFRRAMSGILVTPGIVWYMSTHKFVREE